MHVKEMNAIQMTKTLWSELEKQDRQTQEEGLKKNTKAMPVKMWPTQNWMIILWEQNHLDVILGLCGYLTVSNVGVKTYNVTSLFVFVQGKC